MSAKAMAWALDQMTELPVDKLILIAIGNFADDKHQCFPSRKTLAKIAMCSLDSVDRAIKRLIVSGLVLKSERNGVNGKQTSNCYALPIVEPQNAAPNELRTPSRKMRPHPQPQNAAIPAAPVRPTQPQSCGSNVNLVLEPSFEGSTPSSVPPKPKTPRGARLQPDWVLPDEWKDWARINFAHASDELIRDQADRFRDYWIAKSGQQACKLDWEATWRNWCRTAFAARPGAHPVNVGRMNLDEAAAARKRKLLEMSERMMRESLEQESAHGSA